MALSRRELLNTMAAGLAGATVSAGCRSPERMVADEAAPAQSLTLSSGEIDWRAVRALFSLAPDWTHLASFLLVSHPKPVADAIAAFREKIDRDPLWLEAAAFTDSEGRPFLAIKQALARYLGAQADEICLTQNTTTALALAYQGLRIRPDQEVLTTEHEHYSHHESMRFAAARSGARVRYVTLYDRPAEARAGDIVDRIARAVTPRTRAVGVTWVHSSTGVKIPLAAVAEVIARANRGRGPADRCLLIVDGVHGLGNQDVGVAATGCDFFAAGAHKWLLAPRGTGFLWGRADAWPELRPTVPTFDPDAPEPWDAWKQRTELPPTRAAFVSPGGFVAFEHLLAVPAAIQLHETIGRARIATRLHELNTAFREGAAGIPGVTLHTPRDPDLSGAISAFEVAGFTAEAVQHHLADRRIRTNSSPYKVSYARVAAGIMNDFDDVERVLGELRAMG